MFTKKSTVKIHQESRDFEITTTTAKLNDAELLNHLKNMFEEHGPLTIINIVGNEIRITTNDTLEYNETVLKMHEIKELIYDYINSEK